MPLAKDLEDDVCKIFREVWTRREGQIVPEPENIALGNVGVNLKATVLYADLSGSTKMVDEKAATFSAEIYKAYLHCAAKVIREEGGEITAYDGDRVMAVFIGNYKNTQAVRAALKINYARLFIINPAIKRLYASSVFTVEHVVGVDTSDLLVARTGIRGANDLVWVGRAANYAAKLSSISEGSLTFITNDVYNAADSSVKVATDGRTMWEQRQWTSMKNMTVYRSSWYWKVT